MEGSKASIVRDPTWRPTLGPNSTTFRMVDLLLFAFEGQKTLLAPLGIAIVASRSLTRAASADSVGLRQLIVPWS